MLIAATLSMYDWIVVLLRSIKNIPTKIKSNELVGIFGLCEIDWWMLFA